MNSKKKLSLVEIRNQLTKVSDDLYSILKKKYNKIFIKSYDRFPDEFINYQEYLIEDLARSPADQCWNLFILSIRATEYILKSEIKPDDNKLKIYFVKELVNYSLEGEEYKHYKSIDRELKLYGNIGLLIGYGLLSYLSQNRLVIDLNQKPNERDALYIYYGKELEKYPDSKIHFERALSRISKLTNYKYKNNTGKKLYSNDKYDDRRYLKLKPEADLYPVIWDHITSPVNKAGKTYFTGEITTDIINATKKNRDFPKYINNREFIDEFRKYEERKSHFDLNKNNKSHVLKYDEIPDIYDINVISNINSFLDSLSNPLEYQIAKLRIINKLPIRDIAKKVKTSKSQVGRIIQKLNIPQKFT